MAHFGRAGPPDIKDSYSLLVLNITFRKGLSLLWERCIPARKGKKILKPAFESVRPRQAMYRIFASDGTTADDLYPLFDRYGKVVDIFIPRDRRTGDSRGFAFVRYKYADEAEKAIERLDGRNVDGRDIVVQFAKYGPNAEVIRKGRLTEEPPTSKRHRSRSPRRSSKRVNDDYRYRDYRRRSRSRDRHDNHRYQEKEREYRRRSLSHSASPRSLSRSRSRDTNDGRTKRSRSRSVDSRSPVRHSRSHRSLTPQRHVPDKSSPSTVRSPAPASLSPNARNKSPKPPSMSPSNSGA